jgi:hypothetical protein
MFAGCACLAFSAGAAGPAGGGVPGLSEQAPAVGAGRAVALRIPQICGMPRSNFGPIKINDVSEHRTVPFEINGLLSPPQ